MPSYAVPAFKVEGKTLAGYEKSSEALRFAIDKPLPAELVKLLVDVRVRQALDPKNIDESPG